MHLYLFARGKFEQVELWKCHAQCAYWKFRRIDQKTGKEVMKLVQGSLRPSVLGAYEYVFPKEALAEVCSFFGITRNESYGFGRLGLSLRHFALRKIFGCKKIPKKILEKAEKMPNTFTTAEFERGGANAIIPGVALHVIGIKDDEMGIIQDHYQERL
jgi:hypothetical protein